MRKVLYHKRIQKGALFEKRGQLGRRSRFLSARAAESSLASQIEYNESGFSGRVASVPVRNRTGCAKICWRLSCTGSSHRESFQQYV